MAVNVPAQVYDPAEFHRILQETEPEKLSQLSLDQLRDYYSRLLELRNWISDNRNIERCRDHIAQIRREFELRRLEIQDRQYHSEVIDLGNQTLDVSTRTLSWTKVAAWAAVAGVVITIVLGIVQIWIANIEPSRTNPASRKSLPQTTAPISVSPVPEVISSIAIPSPTQAVQKEPSQSPR